MSSCCNFHFLIHSSKEGQSLRTVFVAAMMMMMMIDGKPYSSSSFLRSICSRVYSSVEVGVGNHRHPTGDRKEKTTFIRIAFASRLTPRLAFVRILVIWGSPSSLWLCMVYKVQAPNGGRRGWLVASPLSPPKSRNPPMHIPRGCVVVSPPDYCLGNPTQPPINMGHPRVAFSLVRLALLYFYYPILDSFPHFLRKGGPKGTSHRYTFIYRLP